MESVSQLLHMDILGFLAELGLEEKEQQVFLTLHRHGSLPVSSLAKKANIERTGCYYTLSQLEKDGLVGHTVRSGVKVYFAKSDHALEEYITKKQEHFSKLKEDYASIAPILNALRLHDVNTPSIQLYEGNRGIKQSFHDMYRTIEENDLLEIRLIATDTFEEELGDTTLQDISGKFVSKLQKRNTHLKSLVAKGNIIKEHFVKNNILSSISSLPASNQASNIYIIGNHLFILSFHDTPVGIQIRHEVIAKLMHFIFDVLESSTEA